MLGRHEGTPKDYGFETKLKGSQRNREMEARGGTDFSYWEGRRNGSRRKDG